MKLKFDWVDIVIILLVLCVGLVGYNYLNSRKSGGAGAETKKLYFVFETEKNTKGMAEQWAVGTHVVFGTRKVDRGVIVASEVVPFEKEVADTRAGVWHTEEVDGQWCARVRIEFDGFESDNAFSATQEQVMTGLGTIVSGRGVNSEGYVIEVGVVE
ncbi:MAG: DUF4330 family protein [Oscillospiraceae bacterium]|nr:DUF4330 family protein [Oscillospiraceae bacterium]